MTVIPGITGACAALRYREDVVKLLTLVDDVLADITVEADLRPVLEAARRRATDHLCPGDREKGDLFLAGVLAARIRVVEVTRGMKLHDVKRRRLVLAAHVMASRALEARLNGLQGAAPIVKNWADSDEPEPVLAHMLDALYHDWGSEKSLTAYGEITHAVVNSPPDLRDVHNAWLTVIGPHYLQLVNIANTAAKPIAVNVHLQGAQKFEVAKWLGISRPTFDRWIADELRSR